MLRVENRELEVESGELKVENEINSKYKMKKGSVLRDKSYGFAIRIVKLSQYLQNHKKEFVLSKQILKSGTAIGALIKEAEHAQSNADFINKLNIALKEANETEYWLNLLKDTDFLENNLFLSLNSDCIELLSMLISSLKTLKQKNDIKLSNQN